MLDDTTTTLSRRTLVGAALGSLGVVLTELMVRPLRAAAAADHVSYVNDESSETVLEARSVLADGPDSGNGIGVHGFSSTFVGAWGGSDSGTGVVGDSDSGTGVRGQSLGGYGLSGQGPRGGGEFSGLEAQVRLVPSGLSRHPESGRAGELFVDRQNRLWFCRGGKRWFRLA